MSGKDPKGRSKGSNQGSAKGSGKSGKSWKGKDPVYYYDAWQKGRPVYDDVMNERRAQRFNGNAWDGYNENYVTYRTVPRPQGGPRPERPRRPRPNIIGAAGGAEYFQMNSEGEEQE